LRVERIETRDGVRQALTDVANPADVLYFYTHGGIQAGSPYLKISTGVQEDSIEYTDLNAWRVNLSRSQPLVVLNACESADYTPERFENLIRFFTERGAAGVLGTQCMVQEQLANAFILRFFEAFWRCVPAGQAVFDARQALLCAEQPDPRGLIYSLFAPADVSLAQPVLP
jgi:CHAT domain-containing protein